MKKKSDSKRRHLSVKKRPVKIGGKKKHDKKKYRTGGKKRR
jgi:hypothetical protein